MKCTLFDLKSSKMKKILLLPLVAALLLVLFFPIQASTAAPITDTSTGVTGRILPANMAGDTSDWIEIAQNGDFSLIVRKNYLNWYSQASRYNDPAWQYTNFGATNNYLNSNVRNIINNWFNGRSFSAADNLPADARLRDYTMQNTAKNVLGTSCNPSASLTNGLSKPTIYQVGVGDDIAFALSYSEAANFCSKLYFMRNMYESNQKSSTLAVTNYDKINFPSGRGYGMWLRSPGDLSFTASAMDHRYGATLSGRVFQYNLSPAGGYDEYGLVYPALWVNSAIFETVPTSYSISYVLNGGVNSPDNPTSYNVTALPLSIVAPTKSGYAFLNWRAAFANGTEFVLQNGVIPTGTTGNLTLTATWSVVQYNISYVLQGGTNAPTNPVTYNVENAHLLSVANATMLGYTFLRWMVRCENGTMFTLTASGIPAGTYGNLTLAAVWDPVPILYSITYDLDGGINAAGNPVEYAVTSNFPIIINNPSKAGYSFLGWIAIYSNGTVSSLSPSYSIPAGSACNVLLRAVWSPSVQSYSISYVLNGGVNVAANPVSYSVSNLPLSIADPSMQGYVFSYWIMSCADGSLIVLQNGIIPAGTVGDVTLTAVWTAAPSYSIEYSLNGGVNAAGNPVSYTVSNTPVSIADPSMMGYTFVYWIAVYADGRMAILPSSGIATGTTGNIHLIAVWYP
jgi:uncharacterized repeat protein (TIGR02543 family)